MAINPSPFVRELIEHGYPIIVDEFQGDGFQDKLANIACSHCQTGYLVPRDSRHGSFFGCSEYPLCGHTQRACQRCGGTLGLRKGPYGEFWGCSNYRKDAEFSCAYKEKFIDLKLAKRHK